MELSRERGPLASTDRLCDDNRRAMVADHEQELPVLSSRGTDSDEELYFRHHPFTKQFTAAIHSLLTSCSRQEVLSYFAQFQPQHPDFVYNVFTITVAQIHEKIVAEFQSICKKTQVLEALDYVSSEEFLCAIDVRQSAPPKEVLREVAVKRKQEEVNTMKQELRQTREENDLLATQLEGLQEKVNAARELRAMDAVMEKIRVVNLELEKAVR